VYCRCTYVRTGMVGRLWRSGGEAEVTRDDAQETGVSEYSRHSYNNVSSYCAGY